MYVGNRFSVKTIWYFAWRNLLQAATGSAAVYVFYEWMGWQFLHIPFPPIATIGVAVAFYIGFKNSQSYERLWEARRIWGGITNSCRSLAAFLLSVVLHTRHSADEAEARQVVARVIHRQIAWCNALRVQLRARPAIHRRNPEDQLHVGWVRQQNAEGAMPDESDGESVLLHHAEPGEQAALQKQSNIATHLLLRQAQEITDLKRKGWIDEFEHSDLMRHVTLFYDYQGSCERIKSFPFPRQYAIFSGAFVRLFIVLLPFGLIQEMAELGRGASWLVVPFSTLIAWVFYTMEQVGDASEDPFEGGGNDVPISTICRGIEVDLREMLGESDLPERLKPVNDVLL